MFNALFANPWVIAQGALIGLVFGFLLQKARLTNFSTVVGQFLFKDFTILKVILTAIIVGGSGIYTMFHFGFLSEIYLENNSILGVIIGGLTMGAGMVLLGYCPGSCTAAAGQGSRDAWWGIVGMICGASLYARIYPTLQKVFIPQKTPPTTVPQLLGMPAWIILSIIGLIAVALFFALEKNKK